MKASEIRIGNYFEYKKHIIRFELGDFRESLHNSQFLKLFVKPIPLTEQWLKDFGFRKYSSTQYDRKDFWSIKYEGTKGFYSNQLECHIKYVHQLQNLYFALTGNELTKQ